MDRNIFIIVLAVILVIIYIYKNRETYVSGSYDITAPITVDMDWKGATLSKYPYYTNNLVDPPADVSSQIQQLQKYQPEIDGPTDSTYVAQGMNREADLDSPENREGFEMSNNLEEFSAMNPYVPN